MELEPAGQGNGRRLSWLANRCIFAVDVVRPVEKIRVMSKKDWKVKRKEVLILDKDRKLREKAKRGRYRSKEVIQSRERTHISTDPPCTFRVNTQEGIYWIMR